MLSQNIGCTGLHVFGRQTEAQWYINQTNSNSVDVPQDKHPFFYPLVKEIQSVFAGTIYLYGSQALINTSHVTKQSCGTQWALL